MKKYPAKTGITIGFPRGMQNHGSLATGFQKKDMFC